MDDELKNIFVEYLEVNIVSLCFIKNLINVYDLLRNSCYRRVFCKGVKQLELRMQFFWKVVFRKFRKMKG